MYLMDFFEILNFFQAPAGGSRIAYCVDDPVAQKAMVLAFDASRWLWFSGFGRQVLGFEPAYTRNDDDDRIPQKKRRHGRDERFWDTRVFFTAIWATIYANGLVSLSKLSRRSICCAVLGLHLMGEIAQRWKGRLRRPGWRAFTTVMVYDVTS